MAIISALFYFVQKFFEINRYLNSLLSTETFIKLENSFFLIFRLRPYVSSEGFAYRRHIQAILHTGAHPIHGENWKFYKLILSIKGIIRHQFLFILLLFNELQIFVANFPFYAAFLIYLINQIMRDY